MIVGASISAFSSDVRGRLASEHNVVSSLESFPDCGSSLRILIPLQKLPNDIHISPSGVTVRFGSMALKSSCLVEAKTSPWSTHRYCGLAGSSVLFVIRPMTDWLLPNVETE